MQNVSLVSSLVSSTDLVIHMACRENVPLTLFLIQFACNVLCTCTEFTEYRQIGKQTLSSLRACVRIQLELMVYGSYEKYDVHVSAIVPCVG